MVAHAFAKRMLVAGLFMSWSSAALADAIDGDWCSTSAVKHFRIAGSSITTPAGTETTGNYSRHAFSYVVPEGDPGAGQAIGMQLLNEDEVAVSIDRGEPKIWRRCEVTS